MRRLWILTVCAALFSVNSARAQHSCAQDATARLPQRSSDALSGSAFAARVAGMSESERDAAIGAELESGNIPAFVRNLVPVSLEATMAGGRAVRVTMCVLSDYLAIGSDHDALFAPMRLRTALALASHHGFTLPTSRMVDAIYQQATVHLAPQPLPAGDQMRSTAYYRHHNEMIEAQRATLGARPGLLTSGHMKDLVLTGRLWHFLDRVAIYGWHRAVNSPIQPLSTVHGANYADYSHGVRLISDTILVDGTPMSIYDALEDPDLARALNGDGAIPRLRQLVDTLSQAHQTTAALTGTSVLR